MKIVHTPVDDGGCGWYRVRQPFEMIKRFTDVSVKIIDTKSDDMVEVTKELSQTDLIGNRQGSGAGMYKLLGYPEFASKKWFYDIDDNTEGLSPYSPHYEEFGTEEFYDNNAKMWVWQDGVGKFNLSENRNKMGWHRWAMKTANLVTVTTKKLAEYVKQYNSSVAVLPNCINLDRWWPLDLKPNKRKRVIWSGGACVDDKTEVLTQNGFKLIKDLLPEDKVATLNSQGELEYHIPTGYIKKKHKGKMLFIDNQHIKMCVTPEHKIYAGNVAKKNFKLKKASDLYGHYFSCKRNAKWIGEDVEYFVIPEIKIEYKDGRRPKIVEKKIFEIDDWLKFLGFWTAEGWTTKSKYVSPTGTICNLMQVGVSEFKTDKNLNELSEIMKKYGFKPERRRGQLRFFSRQLWEVLNVLSPNDCSELYIPDYVKNLPKDKLMIFLDWYLKGDGHIDKNGRARAWTISKKLSDDLTEIALKVGWSASVKNRGIRDGKINDREIKARHDCYQVSFIRNNHCNYLRPLIPPKTQKMIDYDGYVYCIEVENHIFYSRRGGVCHWTGNSHYEDWASIREPLNKLMRELDFDLVMIGADFKGVIDEDNRHRLILDDWMPFKGHSYRMMCMAGDVAVIPLADLPFNHYKSSIKWYEMSAMGVPSLVSNILPYSEDIEDGKTAIGYKTSQQFYNGLKKLLTDESEAKRIAKNARKWVEDNRDASKCVSMWVDAYKNII